MSEVDLSNKAIYDMVNDQKVSEKHYSDESSIDSTISEEGVVAKPVKPTQVKVIEVETSVAKPKFKIERSLKSFIIFVLVIVFIAAFIYFTIYRLGWGIKECMNKNYQDCAALLTPELAPLAATGLLALL